MDLFEQLIRDGEAGLKALVADRQPEHVSLDFKSKSDNSHGTPEPDDRRTLAEALSGFSNSAGGLLIWGIDARKGADGVDCAQGLVPIHEIDKFNTLVTNLIGQSVMPRHEGVRTGVIRCVDDLSSGYLVMDVERSERRPHRSEARNKKGYFKRVGDSFFEMEHYDIEDAFNRLHVAKLELKWRADRSSTIGNHGEAGINATIMLQLRNSSTRTAKFPYLYVRLHPWPAPKHAHMVESPQGYRRNSEGEWTYFVGGVDQVINPETRSSIATIAKIEVRPNLGNGDLDIINGVPFPQFAITVDCRFGCEDARLSQETLTITGQELLDRLNG